MLAVVSLSFLAIQAEDGLESSAVASSHPTGVKPPGLQHDRAVSGATKVGTSGLVYRHAGVGDFASTTRHVPYLLYVPESAGRGVDVVDPLRGVVIGHYPTGLDPQHVVPSYDLKTLWSTNDLANTVTPFDPRTGRPRGPAVAVNDPYNMYFLPGGREAMVVQEQLQQLGFYDAQTMAPRSVVHLDCPGLDHADFTADLRVVVASCEFGHRLVRFDVESKTVLGYLDLPGSAPQDVRLGPDGRDFYVADRRLGGVFVVDATTFTRRGFLRTGPDAHGIYPSRDGRSLYVSNRGNGTISVVDPFRERVVKTWRLPGGGSPDMGGVSPDGRSLWLAGRYDARIYQISTTDGHLISTVAVPNKPHGMCVWPQPGRFSLGHTGNMR
ncbi:MAG: beta-propeller repeat-containing protein [Frankiales bacterium]|nr:beta-propeller repeat-containing protein [Frankiales bacterium]